MVPFRQVTFERHPRTTAHVLFGEVGRCEDKEELTFHVLTILLRYFLKHFFF